MPVDLQRPRDIGRILDDAFALYRAHWRTLVVCAAAVVVPVQLLVFGVGLGWLTAHYDATPPWGASLAATGAQLLIVTPLVTAMTVHVVQRAGQGRPTSPGDALRAGVSVFAPLLLTVLLVTLGVVAGLVALIIPGLILAIRWAVVPQVVVVEGLRGSSALRRGNDIVTGRTWFTLLVVFVANLIVQLLSLIFTLPLDGAAKSSDSQALVLVGQTCGQILALPLLSLAITLLYFTLRTGEREEPTAAERPDLFARRRDEGWQPPVGD